jgi:hypothetical protein
MGLRLLVTRCVVPLFALTTAGSVAVAASPIAPKSGSAMCALTVADFQSVGIGNASKPTANVDEGGASAYCVYAGKSGATGGIELDVFYPAGESPADVKESYANASAASSLQPAKIAGVDEAQWSAREVQGGPPFAMIAVRRSNLVFVISIPAGKSAEAQLVKLAQLVLERLR